MAFPEISRVEPIFQLKRGESFSNEGGKEPNYKFCPLLLRQHSLRLRNRLEQNKKQALQCIGVHVRCS